MHKDVIDVSLPGAILAGDRASLVRPASGALREQKCHTSLFRLDLKELLSLGCREEQVGFLPSFRKERSGFCFGEKTAATPPSLWALTPGLPLAPHGPGVAPPWPQGAYP